MNEQLIINLEKEWSKYFVRRDAKFCESEANGVVTFSGVGSKIADSLDSVVLKELYFRGSLFSEKIDLLIEGCSGDVAYVLAEELEAKYYFSLLKYGDLELMRYSEAKNPERIFELELSIDRFLMRCLSEPASAKDLARIKDVCGVVIKSRWLTCRDVLKIAEGIKRGQLTLALSKWEFEVISNESKFGGGKSTQVHLGRVNVREHELFKRPL